MQKRAATLGVSDNFKSVRGNYLSNKFLREAILANKDDVIDLRKSSQQPIESRSGLILTNQGKKRQQSSRKRSNHSSQRKVMAPINQILPSNKGYILKGSKKRD